jgi:hypothetical protein
MSTRRTPKRSAALERTGRGADLAIFVAALFTIAIVVMYFAQRPGLRLAVDATRTRAYSLSPQTRELLARLDEPWTIAVIMVEDATDAPTREQVDQVLDGYRAASPQISVVRVDPTDPRTFAAYDALLARLRTLEADLIDAYERGLDDGSEAFERLRVFAQQQSAQLERVVAAVDAQDPVRAALGERLAQLGLLAQDGGKVIDAVRDARRVTETQPVSDYETARSILAQALAQWGDELYDMARIYREWGGQPDLNPVVARYAATSIESYRDTAQTLAAAADPLVQLPVLEISSIGRQLARGEAAVLIGPDRSAVIPSAQLFPKVNRRERADGAVAFDRRFRGEQVISAAIRSLLVPQMPMVVFVHGEEQSLLRQNEQHADLVGVGTLLDVSRFDVVEWQVGATERPAAAEGQPVVWVIVPPLRRQGLEASAAELALIRAARSLIDSGASVLLDVHPSLLPRYRQTDPWASLAEPFGLRPDTAQVIFQEVALPDGQTAYGLHHTGRRFPGDHPVARAVHGQPTELVLPVPIEITDVPGVTHVVLADVEPDPRRWLEPDWARKMQAAEEVARGTPFESPLPIVVAAERAHPDGDGRQRFMMVGSGGWLLSNVADRVEVVPSGRMALTSPGNQELLLASVTWLAGMDELIAPSPVSSQVARLSGIERAERIRWGLITVVGVPLAFVGFGGLVWFSRRF